MTPGRRRALATGALLLALLVWDVSRPPPRQWSARLLLGGIHVYQATLSDRLPALGVQCRFEPTCSRYAEVAIREGGAVRGAWRALGRLARCGPWTPAGSVDPP